MDRTGQTLDPAKVRLGRARECEKLTQREVYEPVLRTNAMKSKDAKFIRTKWVDTQKGDDVRCRFVGQEIAAGDPRTDLFASTPPLFLARTVVSIAAWERTRPWSLMALDVSCAFLYAKVHQEIVGRLKKALYGTRDAPQLWQKELASTLKDLGFKDSRLHPGFFYHQGRDIALVSHVDDLLIGGTSKDFNWVIKSIEKKNDIKETDIENAKDGLKFLGRRIERQGNGYVWSADPKHREIFSDEWGLVNANPVSTPVATENDQDWVTREQAQERPKDDATEFRRAVARLNYLSLHRPDLCVAAGKLSRCMARLREGDEKPLKRVLRYLQGEPRVGIAFRWQPRPTQLVVLTDDWAGCKVTRRSTTGIVVKLGELLLCFSSKLQKSVALSSGEAELSAQVGGLTDVLGIEHLFRAFGMNLSVRSCCDSSAARGVLTRLGTGNCDTWSSSTSSGSRRWLQGKRLKFTGFRDSATPRMY